MPPEPASEGLRGAAERSWPEVGMPGDGGPLAEPAASEARRGIRLGSKAADGGRVKCLPIPEPHQETSRTPHVKHFRLCHLHTHTHTHTPRRRPRLGASLAPRPTPAGHSAPAVRPRRLSCAYSSSPSSSGSELATRRSVDDANSRSTCDRNGVTANAAPADTRRDSVVDEHAAGAGVGAAPPVPSPARWPRAG